MSNKLGQGTAMGIVSLNIRDLAGMLYFYNGVVGLDIVEKNDNVTILGLGGIKILALNKADTLPFPGMGEAGLYHTAILFSDEASLSTSLVSILTKRPELFEGSGDHLVSQAFYFHDPEGNGLELYVDRPRSEWRWENGKIVMATLFIDPESFIREHLKNEVVENNARVGHVHLKVGNISRAKEFYVDTLGFEITAEMPTALFVSAGGYHHHLGMNVWESADAGTRSDSLGLKSFEILVEYSDDLLAIAERLTVKSVTFERNAADITVKDPWGNLVILRLLC